MMIKVSCPVFIFSFFMRIIKKQFGYFMTEVSSDLLVKFEVGRFEQARNKAPMSHKANAEMQEEGTPNFIISRLLNSMRCIIYQL